MTIMIVDVIDFVARPERSRPYYVENFASLRGLVSISIALRLFLPRNRESAFDCAVIVSRKQAMDYIIRKLVGNNQTARQKLVGKSAH